MNLLVGPNRTPPLNSTSHFRVHVLSYPNEGIYYLQAICVGVGNDCGVLPILGYINGEFKLVFKQKIKVKFALE